MNRADVAEIVDRAITLVIEREPQLLELDVAERALSHHLAQYISQFVPRHLSVDVEYNRHFAAPKRLDLPRRDALDREIRATTVFPDIIVHSRNSDRENILVLEIKKPGEDRTYDDLKLRAFRAQLRYAHTAHIILGNDNQGRLVREVIWIDN